MGHTIENDILQFDINMDVPSTTSSKIKAFMKNNIPVPQDVLEDIQRGLAKPRRELADLDAEIEELSGRLTQLKIKRDQIQKHISQYDCVLATIRRLPVDILHEIFYHCLPTRRNPTMRATEAPLLLTRVCRAWRQTAHASPSIWARLYITFSDEDSLTDNPIFHGSNEKTISDMLRLRCVAIEQWLSRSGVCPLSISLCHTTRVYDPYANRSPEGSELTLTLLRLLARLSSRWQTLELKMSTEVYRSLEKMVPISDLPMLSSIRTVFDSQIGAIRPEDEPAIAFLQVPNLKKISISNYPSGIFSHPNLSKLTTLSVHWMVSVGEARRLLKDCPHLEYTTLNLLSSFFQTFASFGPEVQATTDPDVISLPHLRALSITDACHLSSTDTFYECIHAPQLGWFDYTKDISHGVAATYANNSKAGIVTLLERSLNLKKLTITANNLFTPQMRRILRGAQSISHLVFGPERRTNDDLLGSPGNFVGLNPVWDLGDLFLQDGEEMGSEARPALLPHLEILEISHTSSPSITDEVLRDIILHRADPIVSKGAAPLKKVVVLFARAKEIDISEELSTHPDTATMDLRLEYSNEPQWKGTHSLSYGLDEFDRSWHHRDIEEEMVFLIGRQRTRNVIQVQEISTSDT